MTKKRFIIDDDGIITDMVDLSMYIDNEDCCEKLNELNDENELLKSSVKRQQSSNNECSKLIEEQQKENEQLKTQIKIFEKLLDENNLDIDWEFFCTVDECKKDSDDYGCKECKYLGDVE